MTLLAFGRRPRRLQHPEDLNEAIGLTFSQEQLEAITAPLEPSVIIAGAGSGKTTVMAARVVWLVGTGQLRPEQVLGLTFTRKAAGELATRIRGALERAGVLLGADEDQGEELIMTYDAFAGRIVAEHGQRIGAETDPMMISGAARFQLADRVVRQARGPFAYLSRLRPPNLVERVLQLDSAMTSHLVEPEQVRSECRTFLAGLQDAPLYRGKDYQSVLQARASVGERLELLDLVEEYARLKQRLGLVEFADQMAMAATIVTEVPAVAELTRAQFGAVLLDEYQDTSSAQARLLAGLFTGPTPEQGLGHPVTAVGDPFQAIYGWRGAAASNILRFHHEFPRSASGSTRAGADGEVGQVGDSLAPRAGAEFGAREPARKLQLSVNRRSGQNILDVANQIAGPLREDPMLARHDPSGQSRPKPLEAPSENADAGEVRAASFETWDQECQWLADRVADLHQGGRIERWSDIAVLLRRNGDAEAVFTALAERDIPVEIVGLGGLLGLPEVADVVSTLRVVNDVTANPDTVRLLTGPRWRIGTDDLQLLGRRARQLARPQHQEVAGESDLFAELDQALAQTDPADATSLIDAVDDPGDLPYSPEALSRFQAWSQELVELRRHSAEPVLDQIRRVVDMLGLAVELRATPDSLRTQRANQLEAFIDAASGYVDVEAESSLPGLLAWLDAELEFGAGLDRATPSEQNSVKLLTVHRAKGLEWPVVFLPSLVDKVFPSDRVTDNWTRSAAALPARLRGDADSIPQLATPDNAGLKRYAEELRADTQLAEDRLAYVAVTRAKELLVVSAHTWRAGAVRARKASPYFTVALAEAQRQGNVDHVAPSDGINPDPAQQVQVPWPTPPDEEAAAGRHHTAALMDQAAQHHGSTGQWDLGQDELSLDQLAEVMSWDQTIDALVQQEAARQGPIRVRRPATLSASALVAAGRDLHQFALDLRRPMPRAVSRGAGLGTRFHQWVQNHFNTAALLEPVDPELGLDEAADPDGRRFEALRRRFLASRWAGMTPIAIEVPFALALGPIVVRGQIDAVFESGDERYDAVVVDWKTSGTRADPRQLAIYRLAWAQANGLDVERVDAVFVHIGQGTEQHPEWLPGADELASIMAAER